jgi:plasmid stability protein
MTAKTKSSPTLTIRKLDSRVVQALKARAQRAGRSMEEEVRVILTETTLANQARVSERLAKIRAANGLGPFDSVALVREARDDGDRKFNEVLGFEGLGTDPALEDEPT